MAVFLHLKTANTGGYHGTVGVADIEVEIAQCPAVAVVIIEQVGQQSQIRVDGEGVGGDGAIERQPLIQPFVFGALQLNFLLLQGGKLLA